MKRYCDKKKFFIQYFLSCVYWKYLFLDNSKYFEMSLKYFEEKHIFLSKCLFIFFIAILCAKMSSVYKPFRRTKKKNYKFIEFNI